MPDAPPVANPTQEITQRKKPNSYRNIILIVALVFLGILWVLSLTAFPVFLKLVVENPAGIGAQCINGLVYVEHTQAATATTPQQILAFCSNLPTFQDSAKNAAIIFTVIFVVALIFVYYLKDKVLEVKQKEGNAIIVCEPHTQLDYIRQVGWLSHQMIVGKQVYGAPHAPFTIASSVPASRFLEFETIERGKVVGYSLWRCNYVRMKTVELFRREFFGRESRGKFRHGEHRYEPHRDLADSTAGKRGKDLPYIRTELEESSATE